MSIFDILSYWNSPKKTNAVIIFSTWNYPKIHLLGEFRTPSLAFEIFWPLWCIIRKVIFTFHGQLVLALIFALFNARMRVITLLIKQNKHSSWMTFIKFVWFNICCVEITCKYVLFFFENVLFNNILKGYLMPTENYFTTQCPFLNLELSSMQQQISFHSSIFGKN